MSAEIVNTTEDILTVRITGKLAHSELRAVQIQATPILKRKDTTNLLVIIEKFEGREPGIEWQDRSWQKENHPYIGKIAVVGEKKWEEVVYMFMWERTFPVEYFQPNEVDSARRWLGQKA